jgi:hypothetical protein
MEYSNTINSLLQKVNLPIFCSTDAFQVISDNAFKKGVPPGYLVPSILCAIGHLMPKSKIIAGDDVKQKFVFYTALLGNPSTGKTPAMDLVLDAVYELERHDNIPDDESQLANEATVEGLIDLLKKQQSILLFFDEGSYFFGSLGR